MRVKLLPFTFTKLYIENPVLNICTLRLQLLIILPFIDSTGRCLPSRGLGGYRRRISCCWLLALVRYLPTFTSHSTPSSCQALFPFGRLLAQLDRSTCHACTRTIGTGPCGTFLIHEGGGCMLYGCTSEGRAGAVRFSFSDCGV